MKALKENSTWLVPLLIMCIITPFTPMLDLMVCDQIFHVEWRSGIEPVTAGFTSNHFFDFLYVWGVLPAQLLCAAAALCLALSPFVDRLRHLRPIFWVLSLNLLIGSGLITHGLLKEFWGRPRPKQIVEFGGSQPFRPFYIPSIKKPPEPSKSFPSGHSTTGFYFFSCYFLGKRLRNKLLTYTGLSLALFLGITLSLARIVQGGHFFSDVLVAALIMWLTAYMTDRLVYERWKYYPLISGKDLTCKQH